MQQAYAGGATSVGHRIVEVSKTVTQQTRPALERDISAGQRAKRSAANRDLSIAGGGLAAAGAGAGISGSGKRKIKRVTADVDRTKGLVTDAQNNHADATANAHGAERGRTAALLEHNQAKAGQYALAHWEGGGSKLPHTARVKVGTTGEMAARTLHKPGTKAHSAVRNALVNQVHDSSSRAKELGDTEHAELRRGKKALGDEKRFSQLHETGVQLRNKVVPKMNRRITSGRALMVGGTAVTAGALVHGERKRVGKSLEGMPLAEISKMIGTGTFRGAASATRAALGRAGMTPELDSRVAAARRAKLVPVKPKLGKPTNSVVTPQTLRTSLSKPRSSELSARLAAARGAL